MTSAREELGRTFDAVAEEYDRVRPGYPDELVDRACATAGLAAGSRVLEIGCGTGKLTRALSARGLSVDAVDPGGELVAVARRNVGDADVRFHVARFEDVELPEGAFEAAFSATAFHWVDPAVSWMKTARVLRPGGLLALLSHVGGWFGDLQAEMLAAWREVVPDAAHWREERDPEALWEGAEARRGNVSDVWAWLVHSDLVRPEAAALFRDVEITAIPIERAETFDDVIALTRTTSAYLRLDPERRQRLESNIARVIENAGGTFRSTTYPTVVTARRR